MKAHVEEYLDLRFRTFPDQTLKPKHHYLLHYADLVLQFGPLIRLWTLRFESKHTFFKQCVRKLHNFKNLPSTLAERHQLFQAYLGAGNLFVPEVQVDKGTEFDVGLCSSDIQDAVSDCRFLARDTLTTSELVYKGTRYKKNMLVVVGKNDDGYIFGRILMILVHLKESVYFLVQPYQCQCIYMIWEFIRFLMNKILNVPVYMLQNY
jgi:hypothetical protein